MAEDKKKTKADRKQALLERLTYLASGKADGDPESWHVEAENLLLEYIDDAEITDAYEKVDKWYA